MGARAVRARRRPGGRRDLGARGVLREEARWDSARGASERVPVSAKERLPASSAAALAAAISKGRCLKCLCGVGAPAEAELKKVICVCCGASEFSSLGRNSPPRQPAGPRRGARRSLRWPAAAAREAQLCHRLTYFGKESGARYSTTGAVHSLPSVICWQSSLVSCASTLNTGPSVNTGLSVSYVLQQPKGHADLLPMRPWIHLRQHLSTSAHCLALLSNLTAAQAAAALLKRVVSRQRRRKVCACGIQGPAGADTLLWHFKDPRAP